MSNDSIRLGLLAPQTGVVSLYSKEICLAATIACDEVNAAGGLLGKKLELIIVDDGSLPETAVPAAKTLIDQYHCSAIIGTLLSNSRIAVSDLVSHPRKVPQLNFSFYEGSIHSRYFFHFAALPNQQIDKMIPFMMEKFGPKFFFAGNNYEWPRGSIDAAKLVLAEAGGEVVGEEYFPIGSDNFSQLLQRVSRSGCNVFVPYAAGSDQIVLLNQFYKNKLKQRIKVVMGHYDEAMAQMLRPEVREGLFSSNSYFMSVHTPQNQRYLKKLATRPEVTSIWPNGNGILTNFGEGTYICVHAFAKAVNAAQTTESEALVKALEQVSLNAPQGHVRMDPATHHAQVNGYLSVCRRDGMFDIVQKFGSIPPVIPQRYLHPHYDFAFEPPSHIAALSIGQHITHTIFEEADIGLLATDSHGVIIEANQSIADLFQYSRRELIGKSIHLLLPPHFRNQHVQHFDNFLQSPNQKQFMGNRGEITGYKKDGSFFPAEATISKISTPDGMITIASLRDISQRKSTEEALLWKATHDPLTQLPNRTLIKDRLDNALARSARNNKLVALLFLDLDEFKLINDNYGHVVGDAALIRTARNLIEVMRPGDTIGRFGGDEFLILCEDITHEKDIYPVVDRIINAVKQPVVLDDVTFYPSVSIGVVFGSGISSNSDELLQNADTAMYAAKQQGRDGWKIYDHKIGADSRLHMEIASGLREAIGKAELEMVLQPIVCAHSECMIGAEALVRWRQNDKYIAPSIFVPVAEVTGSILPIGEWVFEQACLVQAETQKLLPKDKQPYISINLSARQIIKPELTRDLKQILQRTGADTDKLVLEITETTLMTDLETSLRVLQEIGSELGISLAIDDFGTGHSSLSRIKRMPIDVVKLDKVFVDEVEHDSSTAAICQAVCDMAHALGLKVTAEGVEEIGQLQTLRKMHVDNIQGYLFDKPLSPSQFLARMVEKQHGYGITYMRKKAV